uniref:Protein wech n=1 Tax=Sipha flava TaxID=143950 RepID=A0A2S2QI16_9HEMI
MNRTRFPCCSRCKINYNIGDSNKFKIPMLLNCGHDLCKGCLNYQFKKDKKVICDVCNADCKIKNNEQLYETPIHYYLVGKVWYLMSHKKKDILREICNLKMDNLISESSKKVKKNCQLCHKFANTFCVQCNDVFCEVCFDKVHMDNPIMYNHDVEKIDNIHPELPLESKCDLHFKLIEYFCVKCQLQLCSVCIVNGHQQHDIQSLKEYVRIIIFY